MDNRFFTSKEAASIAGCTQRQLQYWREKGSVVPTVDATGTGRSIYYSPAEVAQLVVMGYCLQSGLNFEIAAGALKLLKEKSPDLIQTISQSWLLSWDGRTELLEMVEFDESKAIEWLKAKRVVIMLCFDTLAIKLYV
jgi:DNA-binding transcriptional MerR regulator